MRRRGIPSRVSHVGLEPLADRDDVDRGLVAHGEFVVPSRNGAVARGTIDVRLRRLMLKQVVTGPVAERVVDVLEPVEVQQQQRDVVLGAALGERSGDVLGGERAGPGPRGTRLAVDGHGHG